MSKIALPRQLLSDAGLVPVYAPANGRIILHVRNGSGAAINVTVRSGYARNGLKLADRIVNVPAGGAVFIGPFDPVTYNQRNGGTGQVHVDYSETENVTIAALLIP